MALDDTRQNLMAPTRDKNKSILITGADGFVGAFLCERLLLDGMEVCASVRNATSANKLLEKLFYNENQKNGASLDERFRSRIRLFESGDISSETDWSEALRGIDTVIHLAARVHILKEREKDPLASFMRVNRDGTARLARQAIEANIRRFIYLSTIHVMGLESGATAFREDQTPNPADPYAISKLEAERELIRISSGSKMEYVMVRPPLVYGPGAGGNFARLIRLIQTGIPLPLAGIKNRKTFIGVRNLIDFISLCIDSPDAANRTFHVGDAETISTPDLIRILAEVYGLKSRMFSVPSGVLFFITKVLGVEKQLRKLTESLEVDSSLAKNLMGWKPPFSLRELIREMVFEYGTGAKNNEENINYNHPIRLLSFPIALLESENRKKN